MPAIVPGSAFCPNFKSQFDYSGYTPASELTKREKATKERERQQAKGNHGTIHGLSVRSDEQIAREARIRKNSKLG